MERKIFMTFVCGMIFGISALAAQPSPKARIAGLEGNSEYMSLLKEDAALQLREDSIAGAISASRLKLRENPSERELLARELLDLENSLFALRSTRGRLIDRVNTIEQEWVLSNISHAESPSDEPVAAIIAPVADSLQCRNMIYNSYFRKNLEPEDYAALAHAQELELTAVDIVNRYFTNHNLLKELRENYAAVQTEEEAGPIYDRFRTVKEENNMLADSLSATWNYIFDNKSYAYAYILEMLGRTEILTREEDALSEAMRKIHDLEAEPVEHALADYFLRKRVAADYERSVAGVLSLGQARDSLSGVVTQLQEVEYRLEDIELQERYFIDFESIEFSKTPKYTSQNPIPECKVYEHGTIYRILLGTFNTKRAVSTFRGAYPLSYMVNDEGKWLYFTGGLATLAEAEVEQVRLKKHGFVRPEIVVWRDGVYRNLSTDPEPENEVGYRVEIRGTEVLSDEVKAAITEFAAGCELSRVGNGLFLVGTFAEETTAESFATAVRALGGTLDVKVAQVGK